MKDDAAEIGARIRALRVSADMTQAELGEPDWSPSYISLIESGRRPVGAAMLATLAKRLGCSVHFLQTGEPDSEEKRLDLDLRAGELALRSGDVAEAIRRFDAALEAASDLGRRGDARLARWGGARARELTGRLDEAIDAYEVLRAEPESAGPPHPLRVTVALVRCYREEGDIDYAVGLGEGAREALPEDGSDPGAAVELLSTLAGCYHQRGDLARAGHLVRLAVTTADQLDDRPARAAAYWQASLLAESRGRLGEAVSLAEQALTTYGEDDDARAAALGRTVQAWLLLRREPPDAAGALKVLRKAERALAEHGSAVEIAACETEIARCHLLRDDVPTAQRVASRAVERLADRGGVTRARALLVLAEAEQAGGDRKAARDHQREVSDLLADLGAGRQAAGVWRELGASLERAGRTAGALAAFRAAADGAGLPAPLPSPPAIAAAGAAT